MQSIVRVTLKKRLQVTTKLATDFTDYTKVLKSLRSVLVSHQPVFSCSPWPSFILALTRSSMGGSELKLREKQHLARGLSRFQRAVRLSGFP